MNKTKTIAAFAGSLAVLASAPDAHAAVLATSVALQNATATLSQATYEAGESIDNNLSVSGGNGWATLGAAETIVWETVQDQGDGSSAQYNFRLYQGLQLGGAGGTNLFLRNFRLSYTTSDRATFADGFANGGDVTTRWAVIDDFASLTDDLPEITLSFLASGDISSSLVGFAAVANQQSAYYDITANITANGITGFKLEVLSPPGWSSTNNFVLREIQVTTAIPEPGSALLLGLGLGMAVSRRRRREEKR